jgi:hypothetical protein
MPTYTFEDIKTGKTFDKTMSISERDDFIDQNPDYRQVFTNLNIIGGISGLTHKTDSGWNDTLQKIAEKHPGSPLADRYLKKSIKEVKTRNVVNKHRNRRKNGGR